jgi:alanyl-tRNA synthetase
MTTDELREAYLAFFESKGCVRKASDVLVPNDPTVLFTPAGMNQFKREFMGLGDPSFKRATTCQKCIRTGDIENVGKTPRHMTFFEMLGNFSFGDYFKREAIHWGWEFCTKILGIRPERLTFTVYQDDDEAFDIWHKEVGVPKDRISRLGEDDNFWPAGAPTHGPNGVCGPCSEIFYHGEGVEEVEIWNLVFTQFNRVGVNQLEPLPQKNIDTGMGLERTAAALQGVASNFEIDIFKPIVRMAAELLKVHYPKIQDRPDGIRVRRISDHARALVFTIHENVRPGPEKQGYVVRRLLRRAVLDGYQLGMREPFLYRLAPVVAEVMRAPYPDLETSVARIETVIREEEERFLRNLENGLRMLEETYRKTQAAGSSVISGKDAFELHATYGIPVEITESLAAERNLRVDEAGFRARQAQHEQVSRGTSEAFDVFATGPLDTLKEAYHQGSVFLGYEGTRSEGKIIGILEQGQLAESASVLGNERPAIALVLDQTPFYAEAGGQVGDTGVIRGKGFVFRVEDTQRDHDFTLHLGRVTEGTVPLGGVVEAEVDGERRQAIRRAHTATHLLHHALRQVLGGHAQQAGSKVEPDRLRFDFSNPEAVGKERLRAIEDLVNERILSGDAVIWTRMPIGEARKLGAMALFGEKYPEIVRVVQVGDYSKELCGGTHLDRASEVGLFRIVGEESVAAGTRRITALTGKAAREAATSSEETLAAIASSLKVPASSAGQRVAALVEELKLLKKELAARQSAGPAGRKESAEDLLAKAEKLGDIRVVVAELPGQSMDDLRQAIDVLRRKAGSGLAVLLASRGEDKVQLSAGMTEDLVKRGMHAGQWLKLVAPIVGGGGGGRPDLAQAGGKDPTALPRALEQALGMLAAQVKS